MSYNVVLASQSKMRQKALDRLGISYSVIPAAIDEKAIRDSDPSTMALKIAEAKARAVGKDLLEDSLVISSDSFLYFENTVLEKPNSLIEAEGMLAGLSGKSHEFITGLVILDTKTNIVHSQVSICVITFRKLSRKEIHDYCNRYPVLTFAGGFDSEGVIRFAEKIEGDCSFITAIPMAPLIYVLQQYSLY